MDHREEEEDSDEDEEQEKEKSDKNYLSIAKIDAHWLQRELTKFCPGDAAKSVAMEKHILRILQIDDLQRLENELISLLEYQNFDFARLLRQNKDKI